MGKSIPEYKELIKRSVTDDAIFMVILLVVVGISSFILGQQSVPQLVKSSSPRVSLTAAPVVAAETKETALGEFTNASTTVSGQTALPNKIEKYVASKSGTKYHLPTCPGAKQIKEENKIYFNSEAEARAAGYTPSANCKGLFGES